MRLLCIAGFQAAHANACHRFRHLLTDLVTLMPHAKTESKYDSKSNLYLLNELAELNNCNNCIFFEVRRATDLYMWVSKTPNGPSAKFHVQNGGLVPSDLPM
jgi:ribosome biogenesis protein BRX1